MTGQWLDPADLAAHKIARGSTSRSELLTATSLCGRTVIFWDGPRRHVPECAVCAVRLAPGRER